MIRINKNQIHRFRKIKNGYLYPISQGVYLGFNKNLEYIGLEIFYSYGYSRLNLIAEEKLEDLIAKDLLEVGEEWLIL